MSMTSLNPNKKQRTADSLGSTPEKKPFQPAGFDFTGIVFFTQVNDHNAQMVPSSKNYLNDIQLRILKQDGGANTSLFYFESVEYMFNVFDAFPTEFYYHYLSEVTTVGGIVYAVVFEPKNKLNTSFHPKLRFMTDILPSTSSAEPTTTVSLSKVCFHLSDDDIYHLMMEWGDQTKTRKSTFIKGDIDRFTELFQNVCNFKLTSSETRTADADDEAHKVASSTELSDSGGAVGAESAPVDDSIDSDEVVGQAAEFNTTGAEMYPRRKWSLIGRDVLTQLGRLGDEFIELHVDKAIHKLNQWSWDDMFALSAKLRIANYLKVGTPVEIEELNLPNCLSEVICEECVVGDEHIPIVIG